MVQHNFGLAILLKGTIACAIDNLDLQLVIGIIYQPNLVFGTALQQFLEQLRDQLHHPKKFD
ncbi:hypothetical protein [Alteribacillus bidgolensis]|uniref:hypothetical protein n=1 Tax=Alteribacillus bidgolensis TaxID=930129 RepID=UPI001113E20B|nr:hypothetical protein [Alteribacillus bidgolensis]